MAGGWGVGECYLTVVLVDAQFSLATCLATCKRSDVYGTIIAITHTFNPPFFFLHPSSPPNRSKHRCNHGNQLLAERLQGGRVLLE